MSYEPLDRAKKVAVLKGHLAVYVGQQDSGFHRVLVPVIYFNHPLFDELLREAEEEFGPPGRDHDPLSTGYPGRVRVTRLIYGSCSG